MQYSITVSERAGSGKRSLISVWFDLDVYAPGTVNQTMHK
jgi:hypothetical protein